MQIVLDLKKNKKEYFVKPGGGASLISMEQELRIQKINVIVKKEITKLVAPSIQLEQSFTILWVFQLIEL